MSPDELPPALLADLRREVGELRRAEQRRRFPLGLHAGRPGHGRCSAELPWPMPDHVDAGLRLDLLDALLGCLPDDEDAPVIWWCRPGTVEEHDVDRLWHASAHVACAARSLPAPHCFAVTRYGWRELRTGASRAWKRLRL